jgi:hypothetical protein
MRHYAVGVEYDKDLVKYNQQWRIGIVERSAGRAFNALKNHIHLNPIITHSYPAANLTAASAQGATLEEKTLRTLEAAIVDGENDATNRRSGPYVLMIAPSNRFMIERILNRVPQEGITLQSSAIDAIQSVVIYNGWTGTRGKKTTAYGGVPANTAFLCNMAYREEDFQAWESQPLESTMGDGDVTRFILQQTVWDTYFGMYVNQTRAVQKVALPTS